MTRIATTTLRHQTPPSRAKAAARSAERRGSVLVLVMTMLGVLFVLGVAFMATMNFEAETLAAQARRGDERKAVETVTSDLGALLRGTLMGGPGVPFSDPVSASATAPYAELPQVHGSFSPIEPSAVIVGGTDGVIGTNDDPPPLFLWYTDLKGLRQKPFSGPTLPPATADGGFAISPDLPQGWVLSGLGLETCLDGPDKGRPCDLDADCAESICRGPRLADADGDGIVDSVEFLASDLGLSEEQIAAISAQVNRPANAAGRVFVAVRIVPHGGMVNLNHAHPALIENVLDTWRFSSPRLIDANRSASTNLLYHRPIRDRVFYPSLLEEPILRHRVLLPSENPAVSALQGNPLVDVEMQPDLYADMTRFLLPPALGSYEDVSASSGSVPHRFLPFTTCTVPGGDCYANGVDLWQVRMEPFTAEYKARIDDYDRRHLVTTVSHDDLLARGARIHVPNAPGRTVDALAEMRKANLAAYDPEGCPALPFEYANYPQDIPNSTMPEFAVSGVCECATNATCQYDPRKGRLQLSLPWLEKARLSSLISSVQVERLIHEAFAMMLQNMIGPDWETRAVCDSNMDCGQGEYCRLGVPGNRGRCSSVPPIWDDMECAVGGACQISGEICVPMTGNPLVGLCTDSWTGQRHSQAMLSRTAASLTANLIDFFDADDIPTRVALRSFDFNRAVCIGGADAALPCASDNDCPTSTCELSVGPARYVGREIDGDPGTPNMVEPLYVYGLERQPYITAVATTAKVEAPMANRSGWAVELFNPYPASFISGTLGLDGEYWLYEIPAGSTNLFTAKAVKLIQSIGATGSNGPFTVFYDEDTSKTDVMSGLPTGGIVSTHQLSGASLSLDEDSTLLLVRKMQFSGDVAPTDIVLDQFRIKGMHIGKADAALQAAALTDGEHAFVVSRGVPDPAIAGNSMWHASVPVVGAEQGTMGTPPIPIDQLLGTWRGAPDSEVYPVEVSFANTGSLTDPNPADLAPVLGAFPTTGSLLLVMREANRSLADFAPKRLSIRNINTAPVFDLAFTTKLHETFSYQIGVMVNGLETAFSAAIVSSQQIDNGRLPIFDIGQKTSDIISDIGPLAAHHVPPQATRSNAATDEWKDLAYDSAGWSPVDRQTNPAPGNLTSLPWGQLIFDYFTALPLSNPGPYPPCPVGEVDCVNPNDVNELNRLAASVPRVDQGGLRVHGRINLNAAPWKVMAGLPLIPMNRIPAAFAPTIEAALNLSPASGVSPSEAAQLGYELAQGITAYREAREIKYQLPAGTVTTGSYGDHSLTDPLVGWRGWSMPTPKARRGTGFMTVGELANVRHPYASRRAGDPTYSDFRADSGILDETSLLKNSQNFVAAVAPLVALGDWVTVRSQVFTVYGVFRGEEDPSIGDNNALARYQKRSTDVNSRAIRFQETIDRLPTFLGEPLPARIGGRTVTRYLDTRND